MVLGVVMVPTGIAVYVSKTVAPLFSHTSSLTPTTITMRLSTGTYYVYQELSSEQSFAVPDLQPGDVTISSPDNGQVSDLAVASITQTLGSNGSVYHGVIGFDVVTAGVFNVHVGSPQGQTVSVFVAPGLLSALGRNVAWFVVSGAGGLLFVLGFILLIVRGVQRSRRRAPQQFTPRCANGHPASPQDRFCHVCGAPVYAAAPTMVPQ
jgi:hypothetical protein